MSLLTWILIFSVIGGVLSAAAAALFLLLPERLRSRMVPHLVSFAIGALLGAAFLALLPHALLGVHGLNYHALGLTVLLGILGFFLLEKMVLWRHCHARDCEAHAPDESAQVHSAAGALVLVGDAIHNMVDGVLIGAAFLNDIHLGVVTAVAVAAHEIPQEVGDFAVLLHSGYSRRRAFVLNMLVTLTTLVGAVGAYYTLSGTLQIVPYILAVAAASFIYIAVADLIPGLHKRLDLRATVQQTLLIFLGVAVIYFAHSFLHG
jgi:zinc and cadmium transporter